MYNNIEFSYTQRNNISISKLSDNGNENGIINDSLTYLYDENSFRPFKEGLTNLLRSHGYTGTIQQMPSFLFSKLQEIGSEITFKTVNSWFLGQHRPKVEASSRKRMYEICFALNLNLNETCEFFHHVYYDRAFNCHTIDEAVFYYAFLHNINYMTSLKIISDIKSTDNNTSKIDSNSLNFTKLAQTSIRDFQSIDELKEFLIENKKNYKEWNISARKTLNNFIEQLNGSSTNKEELRANINRLKRQLRSQTKSNKFKLENYANQGLLIQEILFDASNSFIGFEQEIEDSLRKEHLFTNAFILHRFFPNSLEKNPYIHIPYIVKNNFPSKKVMSEILDPSKIQVSKSYDSIRKMLILLKFYTFWLNIKLNKTSTTSTYSIEDKFRIFIDETNFTLQQCGYDDLYSVNPYDWIFLLSSHQPNPINFFRDFTSELFDPSEDDDYI